MTSRGVLDDARRRAEKEDARRRDAEALERGEVTPAELARRNGFFSALDLRGSRLVAIGAPRA